MEFDETKQILAMPTHTLIDKKVTSAWSVMAVLFTISFFCGGTGNDRYLPLILPPVVLVGSCTTSAVWDALWGQPHLQQILEYIQAAREKAAFRFSARETDADVKCLKVCSHEKHESLKKGVMSAHLVCGLHQNNMV